MRKLSGAFALTLFAIVASPAAAQYTSSTSEPDVPYHWVETSTPAKFEIVENKIKSAWYVGGEFGAMIVEDTDVDIGAVDNALRLSHDYGYDGGLFVGYDLGGFRVEAEVAYKKADLDSYNTIIRLPLEGVTFPTSRDAGGNTTALSFMVNGMLDFGDDDGISGFVGGGVGMARVKANNHRNFANATPFLDGSDSKLAWQVFAGVRQAISDNMDVTVKYRFFNVDDVRLTAFNGNESELRFRSHSLLGGITFRFGRTERMKVCQPNGERISVDATCPPVISGECKEGGVMDENDTRCPDRKGTRTDTVVGPFIVFFDWDRWEREELSQEALRVLNEAAAQYARTGSAQVAIEAHADTSGGTNYNQGLSERRLATVRSYLAERGVPESMMTTRAFGEQCPLVDSGDNVREPQNRRVEIYYGDRRVDGPCPPRPGGY